MSRQTLLDVINEGHIAFKKGDNVVYESIPPYGSITLHYDKGKLIYFEKKETKK